MKNIDLNDPRLTDYALNEMEPASKTEFETLLRSDPGAQKAVEEICATARDLQLVLEAEPLPDARPAAGRSPEQAAIIAGNDVRKLDGGKIGTNHGRNGTGKFISFPQFYYVAAGLAAACFAVVVAVQERRERVAEEQRNLAVRHEARERANSADASLADPVATGIAMVSSDYGMLGEQFFATAESASSTFPLRVGTASLGDVRASIRQGRKPERARVHGAELVNAFSYAWPAPAVGEGFATVLEEAEAPWAAGHRLVRVGLKAGAEARDAQVLVEFDPARVRAWRLIGFERDAGMVGVQGARSAGETLAAGQAMTALYEVVPVGPATNREPMLRLTLSYREASGGVPRTQHHALNFSGARFAEASDDFRFAAAVSAYGLILRESPHRGTATLEGVLAWSGAQAMPERAEFAALVRETQGVLGQ